LIEHFGQLPGSDSPSARRRIRGRAVSRAGCCGRHSGREPAARDLQDRGEEELVEANPAVGAEYPKLPRRKWRILEPVGVARVLKAFTDEQARVVFLTLVLTGIRRFELQALRWRDVDLVENMPRVRDSKSEETASARSRSRRRWPRSCGSTVVGRAFRARTSTSSATHSAGRDTSPKTFEPALKAALAAAGVEDRVRAFHDLRHKAITNDAAAGANPIALMTKAGHADMKTTKLYMHMAGAIIRDEADRLEARLLGSADAEDENLVPN
jgi:integrase